MEAVFWGVCAGIPVTGAGKLPDDSATLCTSLRCEDASTIIIFDAGTALLTLAESLPEQGEAHIFITSSQLSHWQGLASFPQLFKAGWRVKLYYPAWFVTFEHTFTCGQFFPFNAAAIKAELQFIPVNAGDTFKVQQFGITVLEPARAAGDADSTNVNCGVWQEQPCSPEQAVEQEQASVHEQRCCLADADRASCKLAYLVRLHGSALICSGVQPTSFTAPVNPAAIDETVVLPSQGTHTTTRKTGTHVITPKTDTPVTVQSTVAFLPQELCFLYSAVFLAPEVLERYAAQYAKAMSITVVMPLPPDLELQTDINTYMLQLLKNYYATLKTFTAPLDQNHSVSGGQNPIYSIEQKHSGLIKPNAYPEAGQSFAQSYCNIIFSFIPANYSSEFHAKLHSTFETAAGLSVNVTQTSHSTPAPSQGTSKLQCALARAELCAELKTGVLHYPLGQSWFKDVLEILNRYKDEQTILDRILFKSRELTRAEAGTLYLLEGNELVFKYTHNDRLFSVDSAYIHAYSNVRLPLSMKSLTGYVATVRKSLNLPDVRKIQASVPYCFDGSFDRQTGYLTVSALTVPVLSRNGTLLGVLQLLNSLDWHGNPQPFSPNLERKVSLLAHEAALVLENSKNTYSNITRLLHIISLHDKAETLLHAQRVGALSAEIYQRFAEKRALNPDEIRDYKGQLRLSSMLHDIGKVGVSNQILHKEDFLTTVEREQMAAHVWLGATLFHDDMQDISPLTRETTLHHHQKWDGSGYGGQAGEAPLAGADIPLSARITTISDVFDSLVSARGYSGMWSFEDALQLVQQEAGRYFDPLLVECFTEIEALAKAIYQRYPVENA